MYIVSQKRTACMIGVHNYVIHWSYVLSLYNQSWNPKQSEKRMCGNCVATATISVINNAL